MSKHTLPECYEVTRDGRVISYTKWRGHDWRELVQHLDQGGYPCVRVVIKGKSKRIAVHKLVARAYLGPQPAPGYEVRHLDGNKLNSHAGNLAWGTPKDNADDRERHGRTSRGSKHAATVKGRPSPHKGKHLSDEHKAKLSAAMRGKPWSEARRSAQEARHV